MSKKKNKNKKLGTDKQKSDKGVSNRTTQDHRWLRRGIVIFLSFVTVFLSLFWFPGDIHYEIKETYTISANEAGSINLAVLLPTSGLYQEVLEPDITWSGEWDLQHVGRLNKVLLEMDLESGQTVEAVVKYRVHLFQGGVQWHEDQITADDLSSTENIQPNHPDIIAEAEGLQVNSDARATARSIFKFSVKYQSWLKENTINEGENVLDVNQPGLGGHNDPATVMVALSRASSIPSRHVNGLLLPEIIPFISRSATWDSPTAAHDWVELYVDDSWILADPGLSGQFYKRDLFGWTDGKHLVYDQSDHESDIFSSLISDAEEMGTWITASTSPMRFVAWSDISIENVQFTPEMALRKVWDARWVMIISVIVILVVFNWLYEEDKRRFNWREAEKKK